MFWSIMAFALFEAATSVTFSQNATELAEMRFQVDPIAAGWYAAVSQNGGKLETPAVDFIRLLIPITTGLFFVPLLGMFLDRYGQRASASMCPVYIDDTLLIVGQCLYAPAFFSPACCY
jgi:hypothetical protein